MARLQLCDNKTTALPTRSVNCALVSAPDAGLTGSVILNERNFVGFVDGGTVDRPHEARVAASEGDGRWGHIDLAHGPQEYKAFFNKALGVMGEYFEQISYANRYEGRIEASTTVPVKDQAAANRRGVVNISASHEGGFSISVRVYKAIAEGAESSPFGRDAELERARGTPPPPPGRPGLPPSRPRAPARSCCWGSW
jgi:hypothetical protein